ILVGEVVDDAIELVLEIERVKRDVEAVGDAAGVTGIDGATAALLVFGPALVRALGPRAPEQAHDPPAPPAHPVTRPPPTNYPLPRPSPGRPVPSCCLLVSNLVRCPLSAYTDTRRAASVPSPGARASRPHWAGGTPALPDEKRKPPPKRGLYRCSRVYCYGG